LPASLGERSVAVAAQYASALGTFRTSRDIRVESAIGGKAA
jgi:hypothetical protein